MVSIANTLNNRYRLDKQIGEGGFAQVFLSTDLELGRQVAIKILAQDWAKDKELLARFRNEARAVAALEHPNILVIYDFGVAKGTPYLVMPYISGGTLAEHMKRERFTFDEIGSYLDQIGSALDYAHQRGIVHRDVKPSNLLMRSNGQLMLMDFGLAKLLANAGQAEQTGIFGTVAYMAPEQLQGMVSAASDIYMLGAILYELLAGKLPYEGNTSQILVGHMHSAPISLSNQERMRAVSPDIVQALNKVITKVLAKVPAERYPTCQALTYAYYQAIRTTSRPQPSNVVTEATEMVITPPALGKRLLKPARLIVTTEPDQGFHSTFELTGETATLGRAKDNTIFLPLAIVSRYHAVFNRFYTESQEVAYKVTAHKSINPLRIQRKEITEKVLENGDVIEIGGKTEYIVRLTYQAPEYGFS